MHTSGQFLACCFGLAILLVTVLADEEQYLRHSAVLDADNRYLVQWGLKGKDEIVFKVTVKALGYVALGFSPNGGMPGSDIATGWVKDGKAFLQDRYAEGKYLPRIDKSQDWHLISGQENATHTTLVFKRKLETCDKDDRILDASTMRMIYAFSDEDPKDENSLVYHKGNRGSKSVLLMQPEMERKPNLEGIKYWDVLSPNYVIKKTEPSMYWCKINKGPDLSKKHHVIMVEPIVQKGHESYLHHMILYECLGATGDTFDPLVDSKGHQCYTLNMPEGMSKCQGVYAAWGVGGESLVFPDHVGMPLDPNPPKYYMLEVHYDNPGRHGDFVDKSGLRLHYTDKLREKDAGSLMVGAPVNPIVIIPPGQPNYVVAGHSDPQCLGPVMPKDGVKLIGVFQHAHLLGRHLKTRHFRNGVELPPFADDSNYDFNYQEYHYFPEELTLLPEDQVTVECGYNSTGKTQTTFGGLSTMEEMCVSFFLYYPRIPRFQSCSVPKRKVVTQLVGGDELTKQIGESDYGRYIELLTTFDWSKTNVAAVEKGLRFGDHEQVCSSGISTDNITFQGMISYPKNLKEYVVPSVCGGSNSVYNLKWNYYFFTFLVLLLI